MEVDFSKYVFTVLIFFLKGRLCKNLFYLRIVDYAGSLLLVRGLLSLVAVSRGHSLVVMCRLLVLVSLVERGLWGTWAWLPQCTCDLPGPGTEPTSSALAGAFLTTGPPGKSQE